MTMAWMISACTLAGRRPNERSAVGRWGRQVLRRPLALMLSLLLLLTQSACSINRLATDALADALAGQGEAAESDLLLARDAAPLFLKVSESVLAQSPGHIKLAESVAKGFTQYAYAFVAFEAEQLALDDPRRAQPMLQRASQLYWRAQRAGLNTLARRYPTVREPGRIIALHTDDVGLAYWTAASWASAIALSTDEPDAVADLPVVHALALAAWDTDPSWGQGDLAAMMGALEMARPGGNKAQAQRYFEAALTMAAGKNPGVLMAKAESWAKPAQDRALFEQLLAQVLAAPPGQPPSLSDQIMRRRATWLLTHIDQWFLD